MVSNILQKKEKNSKEKQNLLNKIEKEIKNIENIKLKLEKLLTIYEQQYDKRNYHMNEFKRLVFTYQKNRFGGMRRVMDKAPYAIV